MKTIKFIAFFLLILCATISEAQTTKTTIAFSYDAAGNRVKRQIILGKSSKASIDSTSLTKPVSELMGDMKITIYPNPTQVQLSVAITNMPQNASGEITIYNMAGKQMQYRKTLETINQFDLSVYPTGIYVLRLKVGQKVSEWKIIKQ